MTIAIPVLTPEQTSVLQQFKDFMVSDVPCFILRGSAGTGKTTMLRHITLHLEEMERAFAVLAPTGRAARVLNHKTGIGARTIHSCIYDFEKFESDVDVQGDGPEEGAGITFSFKLKQNDSISTVFIVDEASMVSDAWLKQEMLRFGSGRLLFDLARFSNTGVNDSCVKFVFVGDYCQLPPIGMSISPTLDVDYLREHHKLRSVDAVLNTVIRQSGESAILDRATGLRRQIDSKTYNRIDISPADGQIIAIRPEAAVDLATEAAGAGRWLPIIARSNRTVASYNRSVRGRLWGDEYAPPKVGDYLIVIKNSGAHCLLNGDNVKVSEVLGDVETRTVGMRGKEKVELQFRKLRIDHRQPDNAVLSMDVFILENCLYSDERQPTEDEVRALYVDFLQRHRHLRPRTEEFNLALRSDPYFNALLVKFGYAMTCHKAQGGEWNSVIVDFSGFTGRHNPEYYRWVYTAITRARQVLYTIDAPRFDEFSAIRQQAAQVSPPVAMPINCIDAGNPTDDPDFLRFSFPADKQFLFYTFVRFRDTWASAGITVAGVRHLPYQEHITVRREGASATVQYHYKGNGSMTPASPSLLPGGGTLGDEALQLARQALVGRTPLEEIVRPQFVLELEERIREAILESAIELRTVTSKPYRERYEFVLRGQTICFDFSYNAKQQWTTLQQVGGDTPAGSEVKGMIMAALGED